MKNNSTKELTEQEIIDVAAQNTKDLSDESVAKLISVLLSDHSLAVVPQMVVQIKKIQQEDSFEKHVEEKAKQNG